MFEEIIGNKANADIDCWYRNVHVVSKWLDFARDVRE
jgi:hypothetical protein